jgi:hypothetical protein
MVCEETKKSLTQFIFSEILAKNNEQKKYVNEKIIKEEFKDLIKYLFNHCLISL